ncbi:hydroxyacid dehydrogenase [Rhodococcus sp. 05-340-1]|uniref:C-terminal binding protein n=1 Tax=unclassified Rhodococcus (in: high G+C Gram-positive bacteria) TaxID=192944 RepID=UPI000B9C5D8E|nr:MULTISPECIES: C-terminal binding protein [unclassified Rhodococcus (in: high G+C Gram-positive bacteria)]OZD70012.1 hydroxyacid dehydrogenase [Rhodococcus sp. 05-340-2]OZD83389.1 hydroxyacid dehydrogenase [Rhodococcus sp. 05-340-1]OZF39530.1 hydroxyacid dehydrogenase [Rhodococcus sp. 14-2483-1-2]
MPKIVITDYEFPDLKPELGVLEGHDIELVAGPFASREDLIAACEDADAVINQYVTIDQEFITRLRNCRVICRYGIGVNTIDVASATAAGIMVANVPDGSLDDVSDHAAAMILSLSRGLVKYDRALRSGEWNYQAAAPLHRLRGGLLGLVGFGNIPQRLAFKMRAFGMEPIAYDPYLTAQRAEELGVRPVDLAELMRLSDVVSVHAPLTDSTRGLIGATELASMKSTAFLVNTSRGGILDEDALAVALRTGSIAGAGLDVFAQEPLPVNHEFALFENTVLSPHCAWYSEESEVEIRTKTARNAVETVTNGRPVYLVNTDVEPRRFDRVAGGIV